MRDFGRKVVWGKRKMELDEEEREEGREDRPVLRGKEVVFEYLGKNHKGGGGAARRQWHGMMEGHRSL